MKLLIIYERVKDELLRLGVEKSYLDEALCYYRYHNTIPYNTVLVFIQVTLHHCTVVGVKGGPAVKN